MNDLKWEWESSVPRAQEQVDHLCVRPQPPNPVPSSWSRGRIWKWTVIVITRSTDTICGHVSRISIPGSFGNPIYSRI